MSQERLSFVSCGRPLAGTLRVPDGHTPAPCVVLCHGFGSYDDDIGGFVRMAELLAQAGMASFRFSFSGSHPYVDKGTIRPASQWVDDALAAVARVQQESSVDRGKIGLLGISVGGGQVVQAAALCGDVRCVVALAPVADGEAWLKHRWLLTRGETAWQEFVAAVETDNRCVVLGQPSRMVPHFDVQALPDEPGWNALLDRFPQVLGELTLASVWDTLHFKPLYYAHAVTQPLCLIHGDADDSVPVEHSRQIHERARGDKVLHVLPGAPHCPWDSPFERRVQEIALDWLKRAW
jgi:dipeptidyl aminopeptidase/acylaminoacyl peptidase